MLRDETLHSMGYFWCGIFIVRHVSGREASHIFILFGLIALVLIQSPDEWWERRRK